MADQLRRYFRVLHDSYNPQHLTRPDSVAELAIGIDDLTSDEGGDVAEWGLVWTTLGGVLLRAYEDSWKPMVESGFPEILADLGPALNDIDAANLQVDQVIAKLLELGWEDRTERTDPTTTKSGDTMEHSDRGAYVTEQVKLWIANDSDYVRQAQTVARIGTEHLAEFAKDVVLTAPRHSAPWHVAQELAPNDWDRINWKQVAEELLVT